MKGKKLSLQTADDLGIGGLASGFGGMLFQPNGGYENRKVARFGTNGDDLIVDTAYTPDTGFFETGIVDKRYYDDWIIIEEYKTKEESQKGHNKWIKIMTKTPPKTLEDIHSGKVYIKND